MIITFKKKLVSGVLAFSLMTTSFGGAFAASAYANTPENVASESEQTETPNKDILIGLAAIGVIAALASGGDDDKSSKQSSGSTTPQQPQTPSTPSGTTLSAQEQQALTLLNNDRAKNGLPALKSNSQLTRVAESHAKDMIARGYFAHNTPEGKTPFQRMQEAGITYSTAGENLAINSSVAAAETAFMNSSGHRANILNSSYTDVGVGVVQNSSGQMYVVQEFIRK
ncbi:serine protease [Anaerosporomusa subterranea]|jgi:uncharacterized protein YkwD|uniref:Serine protease n=1 Tax=Anaerosporomusa subterranea TaxID=1794912 RepID=A0A154BS25_ANASB|nr:CAP domain-containing protein [Anaerosporomusa subterranea]KYZ76697.1 serine protease [Anaerosporomusa subterranea]